MKKIYSFLMALLISAPLFAGDGWFQGFTTAPEEVNQNGTAPNDAWYRTAYQYSAGFLGQRTFGAWFYGDGGSSFTSQLSGIYLYFNASEFIPAQVLTTEFSVVSPSFTPESGLTSLYYKIQELRVSDSAPKTGEKLFIEVFDGTEWITSVTNLLEGLDNYNVSTSPAKVFVSDLTPYIGSSIKIRFRGVSDNQGSFATVLHSVALVKDGAIDLAVSTQRTTPFIPLKHANQVLNASVSNLANSVGAGLATVAITSTPASYNETVSVPALEPFTATNLSFATPFEPNLWGNFKLDYNVSVAGDINTDNNTAESNTFNLTPGVFSVIDGGTVDDGMGNTQSAYGYQFTLTEADEIESVSVAWGDAYTPTNPEFKIQIFKINPVTDAVDGLVYTSEEFSRPSITPSLNGKPAQFIDYRFATAKHLDAGTYIFAIKQSTTTGSGNIGIGMTYGNASNRGYYQVDVDWQDNTKYVKAYQTNANLFFKVNTALSGLVLTPANDATGVANNNRIILDIKNVPGVASLKITPGLNAGKITINGVPFAGTATLLPGVSKGLQILAGGHPDFTDPKVTVHIPAGTIEGFDRPVTWTFSTNNTLQPIALAATDPLLPAADATNVPSNTAVSIQFDKKVNTNGAPNLDLIYIRNGAGNVLKNVAITIDEIDSTLVHIKYSTVFGGNTEYTVVVPENAIKGYTASSWKFKTIADIARSATYPGYGGENVAIDSVIKFVYNREILYPNPVPVANITFYEQETSTAFTDFTPTVENGNSIVINHGPLKYNTTYNVRIPAGTIENINSAYTLSFTTELEPLSVSAKTPEGPNIAIDALVSITFDKAVATGGDPVLSGITIKAGDVALDGISAAIDETDDKTINITHAADFANNTEYTVTIPANAVVRFAGISWTFTTITYNSVDVAKINATVFPTLSKGEIIVTTASAATIKVVDYTGTTLNVYQSTGSLNIPLNYANGLYLVIVEETGKAVTAHKVILQK